jgi:hypothetical protein
LFHELYHHRLIFHQEKKRPPFPDEQERATAWAEAEIKRLALRIFYGEEYAQQRQEIKERASNQAL